MENFLITLGVNDIATVAIKYAFEDEEKKKMPLNLGQIINDQKDKIATSLKELLRLIFNTFPECNVYIVSIMPIDTINNDHSITQIEDFFETKDESLIKNKCNKKFYVSPFIEMECEYNFSVTKPGSSISVIINQNDKEGKLLYASQDGIVQDLTNKNLLFNYLKHPLMTFKVIVAIHYEAFKLWFKKVKLVKKKIKILNKVTFETNEYK